MMLHRKAASVGTTTVRPQHWATLIGWCRSIPSSRPTGVPGGPFVCKRCVMRRGFRFQLRRGIHEGPRGVLAGIFGANGQNYLAHRDDAAVGMVRVVAPQGHVDAELMSLWVAPAVRGRG